MATFAQGDAAGLAALYTEEGQVLPPNGDFVTGHEQLEAFWGAVFGMGVKKVAIELVELEAYGDTAVEVSRFTMFGDEEQTLDKGKFIVVWKQDDDQWKLHRDIFNSSMPPPG
jgi:uncharacterized protein (TIGR02246 family)